MIDWCIEIVICPWKEKLMKKCSKLWRESILKKSQRQAISQVDSIYLLTTTTDDFNLQFYSRVKIKK